MDKIKRVVLIKTAPEKIIQGQWYHRPWLGLGVLASFLIDRGIGCDIVDMHFSQLTKADLITRLGQSDSALFGITSMTHEVERASELAVEIKHNFPDIPIVIGGCHVTALPQQTLCEFPVFDYGVIGEGEYTLTELIDAVNEHRPLHSINGLCFRSDGQVLVNQRRDWIENLDSLPFPAWHLYPRCQEYPLYSSRGCPFECVFCMRVFGRKVRYRSPQNIVDEIESVVEKYSPQRITFQDETFTVNINRANEILDLIIQKGLHKKVSYDISTRVNIGDLTFFKRLKEAGCYKICIGVESGNDQVLKEIRKGITKKDAENCVALAKRAGLNTEAYYILGHPNETKDKMLQTINFAARLNTTTATFGIMVPYPGTAVYEMATKGQAGYKLISSNWRSFDKHLGNSVELKDVSRAQLEYLQMCAYLTFYLKNFRFLELLRFAWGKKAAIVFLVRKLLRKLIRVHIRPAVPENVADRLTPAPCAGPKPPRKVTDQLCEVTK